MAENHRSAYGDFCRQLCRGEDRRLCDDSNSTKITTNAVHDKSKIITCKNSVFFDEKLAKVENL